MPGPTLLVQVAAAAGAPGRSKRTSTAPMNNWRTFAVLVEVLDVQLPVAAGRVDLEEVCPRPHPETRVGAGALRIRSEVQQCPAVSREDVHLKHRTCLARTEKPVHAPVGADGEGLALVAAASLPDLRDRPGLPDIVRSCLKRERGYRSRCGRGRCQMRRRDSSEACGREIEETSGRKKTRESER